MRRGRKKKTKKAPILSQGTVISLSIFLFCISLFTLLCVHAILNATKQPHKVFAKRILRKVSLPLPTPTIDLSTANTFKQYTSALYGFTVTYPTLGIDKEGKLTSCGNNIEELLSQQNFASTPVIHVDSFYQITIQPWGAQLSDYLVEKDKNILSILPFVWVKIPNVDESVIFTAQDTTGYFKDVFALYKKGNLIYQLEKPQGYTAGCQMVFDPRDETQILLTKNPSQDFTSLLFDQYKNWNETTSIQILK